MKFGLTVPTHGKYGDPQLLIDLAVSAENAGWDAIFLWDHVAWAGKPTPALDVWVVLAAIAARTTRINIGPMVAVLPRRRPWKLAREVATLDQLSGGRVIFGAGLGASAKIEFTDFGEEGDARIRAEKLDESLDLLNMLWSGQAVSYEGAHFSAETNGFLPIPRASMPIWIAGYWPHKRPMRRAARFDGVFPLQAGASKKMMSLETVREILAYTAKHRKSDKPFDFILSGLSTGEKEHDIKTAQTYAEAGATWWLEYCVPGRGTPKKIKALIEQGPPR